MMNENAFLLMENHSTTSKKLIDSIESEWNGMKSLKI